MKTLKPNFFLDIDRTNSEGLAPIRVRSRHNSSKLIVKASGLFCAPGKWNYTKGVPKDTIQENQLDGLKTQIKTTYESLSKQRTGITLNDVWEKLYPAKGQQANPESERVVDWIDHYISNSPYSSEYVRGAKNLKVHLTGKTKKGKVKAFNPDLRFSELNQSIVDSFCKHIVKQGKSTGTVVKVVKFLKQIGKMARDYKIDVGSLDFKAPKNYKKKVRTEVRLTFTELMKVQALELEDTNESIIRDMFLFLAFTGMRHSDMLKLTPANDFTDFLHFNQQKTGDEVAVTLHKYSKPLVKKYAQGKEETERLFPTYSQQYFNKAVKTVARKAGLKDLVKVTRYSGTTEIVEEKPKYLIVKTHTGRRSFSRMLSMLFVAEEIIAEEMGHGGKSITRHYIGNSDHMNRVKTVQKAWSKAEAILTNGKALMKVA
jgi:integrase